MNTSALVLMISTITMVTGVTLYFFIKVLSKPEEVNQKEDSDQ